MVKIPFHFAFLAIFLAKIAASLNKHCQNETDRCFWLGTGGKKWHEALAACQSQGGDLAVMETEELHNFASNLFKSRYLQLFIYLF